MRNRKLLLLLCLPALLPAGCGTDDEEGMGGDPVAVQFGSGGIATTARTATTLTDETEWTRDDRIGIFMVKNGETLSAVNIAGGADNREYKADGDAATCSFTPANGTPVYYPQDGGKVDFIAYYPYETTPPGYALPINVSDQSDASKIDVLYSNNATAKEKSGSPVDLQFCHALSKLSFTLTSGTGSPNLAGAKVEISGVATTGTMSLADGMVAATNSGQTVTAHTATDGLTSSAIMIPQVLSGTKLTITLADGVSVFDWVFTTSKFEAGKNYPYKITVNKTGITVTVGDITYWEGTGDQPTEGVGGIYYSVGDYYLDPNVVYISGVVQSGTAAIGVVFWVDPDDGRHGKVVGLKEESNVRWSYSYSTTDAKDTSNGRTNMKIIHDFASGFDSYPAFAWVHNLNPDNTDYSDVNATGVWYLPAKDELQHLYCAWNGLPPATWPGTPSWLPSDADKNSFNAKLTAAEGAKLVDNWYWSSSENDANGAWAVYFDTGSTNTPYKYFDDNRARCVLAF